MSYENAEVSVQMNEDQAENAMPINVVQNNLAINRNQGVPRILQDIRSIYVIFL